MIELYAAGSPNVLRVIIALEELGLPYRTQLVDIFRGEQFHPEFLALNPLAKVPVIVDSDGHGGAPITIFESAAILTYLADKTGGLMPVEPRTRHETLQWLTVQVTTTGPMIGQLVHFLRYAPTGDHAYSEHRYRTQTARIYEVMNRRLAGREFLAGSELTVADIALFPWTINFAIYLGADREPDFANLLAWRKRMADRPAVVRALAVQAELRKLSTTADQADPGTVAMVFGYRT